MATVSMRIDESLISAARTAAKAEFRTVQGQVEFWAKVGRAALDNPDLPAQRMEGHIAQINPINFHSSLLGVIKTQN